MNINSNASGFKLGVMSGIAGTTLYLSPEQVSSKEKAIYFDNKVDIFALGLILLEITSNMGTFQEKVHSFNKLKMMREIPDGCSARTYPEGEIILKLTEPSPHNRPSA